jgi:hypothetical protein
VSRTVPEMKRAGATSLRAIRHHLSMLPPCSRRTQPFTGKSEHRSMGLTLRPTGLGSAADTDRRGLHGLQWRICRGPNLRRAWRARGSPVVLGDHRHFWHAGGHAHGWPRPDARVGRDRARRDLAEVAGMGKPDRDRGVKRDDFCLDHLTPLSSSPTRAGDRVTTVLRDCRMPRFRGA